MGYLIFTYFLVGLGLLKWVPRYLKKKNISTVEPSVGPSIILGTGLEIFVVAFYVAAIGIWPIIIPLWIWSETASAEAAAKATRIAKAQEEEIRQHPNMALSFDQKLELLKKLSEEK